MACTARTLILLFWGCVTALSAREVRVLLLESGKESPAKLFFIGSGVEAEFDVLRLSPSVRSFNASPLPQQWSLSLEKPTPAKPLAPDAPRVSLPEGKGDILIILISGDNALGLRALPVTLPDTAGESGSLLWFNLQEHALRIQLGETPPIALASGQCRRLVPPVALDKPYGVRVDWVTDDKSNPAFDPLLRATWMRADQGQVWLFAVRSPEQSFPRILEVPDFSNPVSKEISDDKKRPR